MYAYLPLARYGGLRKVGFLRRVTVIRNVSHVHDVVLERCRLAAVAIATEQNNKPHSALHNTQT